MAYTSDVIVVGLGGLGSAACHHLATRGLRVVGVDQFQPAHARGASHGETRGVWQAYFMGPGYVPFLQRAYELWDHLAELRGEPFFHRTGGICLGPADGELVPAALASAKTCGLPHEYLDAAEVRRRFPTFTPAEDDVAVFDASSGYVRPELVIQAHIDLADKAGAILRFGEAVVECATTSSGVRVRTAAETYEADKLVVAAGAWIPKLFPQLTLPIQVLRKVMLWFDPIKGPEDFLPGRQPYWIWEGDGAIGYGHPAVDGVNGGVKAGIHSGGDPANPDELDRFVRAEEVDVVRAFLRDRIPQLAGRYLRSGVCMYDNTPDLAFVLGLAPSSERIVLAGGTSGHAFKFVPAIGEAIAELVIEGKATQDISLFAPDRFGRRE
ncbi:MAG: N-methyl-L-tryptophan oxidase [Proteobacteria bacterium]|nr:N-methyl-L-tryptophan oxidase [Pseudomonadota bacterium]